MNRNVRIILYVVLLTVACLCAVKSIHAYRSVRTAREAAQSAAIDEPIDQDAPATNTLSGTNSKATTNLVVVGTNLPANAAVAATNVSSPTNSATTGTATVSKADSPKTGSAKKTQSGDGLSAVVGYGAVMLLAIVGLAFLIAHDFSHFVAERFHKFLLSDEGEGFKDPEYERAEQLWANSQFLDAIQLMRDYLKKNPRKLYVGIRIAEIYEKDLGNYLAAALEYEEVLEHRLLPEQWGWAAIHLANLYSGKLNQTEKAAAWLRRIVAEHGETAAAAKARSRLGQIEGGADTASAEESEPPPPGMNLPKGFRPRTEK